MLIAYLLFYQQKLWSLYQVRHKILVNSVGLDQKQSDQNIPYLSIVFLSDMKHSKKHLSEENYYQGQRSM